MIYGTLGFLTQPIIYRYKIGVLWWWRSSQRALPILVPEVLVAGSSPNRDDALCVIFPAFLSLHTVLTIYNVYMCVLLVYAHP